MIFISSLMMKISYANNRVGNACVYMKRCTHDYGADCAAIIMRRRSQMEAAVSLAEFLRLPGKGHELTGDLAGHYAVAINADYRIIFRPLPEPPPRTPDGGIDTDKVVHCLITEIRDYHDR